MHKIGVLLVLVTALAFAQAQKVHQKTTNKSLHAESTPPEDRLRFRLEADPHNSAAHKQLIELLRKKNDFRTIAVEDANWLNNNRTSSIALIELVSYAES